MGAVPGARPRQLRGARAAGHPPPDGGRVGEGGGGAQDGPRAPARLGPRVPDARATSTPRRSRPTRRSSTTARRSRSSRPTSACGSPLGEVLEQSQRPQEALAEAEAVLAADPKNRFALDLKGASLRDLRRFDEAQAVADRPWPLRPQRPEGASTSRSRSPRRAATSRAAAALLEEILARQPPRRGGAAPARRVFLVHLGFAYQQLERYRRRREGLRARHGRRRSARRGPPGLPRGGAATSRRTRTRLSRPCARPASASRTTRTWPGSRPRSCARRATRPRPRHRRGPAGQGADRREGAGPGGRVLPRAKRYADAEAALRQARTVEPKNLRAALPAGRGARAPEALRRGRDGLPRGPRVEPDSAPVLNYLGYMNADRNVRVDEALTLDREGGGARSPRTAPTSTAWAGRCSGWTGSRRRRRGAARAREGRRERGGPRPPGRHPGAARPRGRGPRLSGRRP